MGNQALSCFGGRSKKGPTQSRTPESPTKSSSSAKAKSGIPALNRAINVISTLKRSASLTRTPKGERKEGQKKSQTSLADATPLLKPQLSSTSKQAAASQPSNDVKDRDEVNKINSHSNYTDDGPSQEGPAEESEINQVAKVCVDHIIDSALQKFEGTYEEVVVSKEEAEELDKEILEGQVRRPSMADISRRSSVFCTDSVDNHSIAISDAVKEAINKVSLTPKIEPIGMDLEEEHMSDRESPENRSEMPEVEVEAKVEVDNQAENLPESTTETAVVTETIHSVIESQEPNVQTSPDSEVDPEPQTSSIQKTIGQWQQEDYQIQVMSSPADTEEDILEEKIANVNENVVPETQEQKDEDLEVELAAEAPINIQPNDEKSEDHDRTIDLIDENLENQQETATIPTIHLATPDQSVVCEDATPRGDSDVEAPTQAQANASEPILNASALQEPVKASRSVLDETRNEIDLNQAAEGIEQSGAPIQVADEAVDRITKEASGQGEGLSVDKTGSPHSEGTPTSPAKGGNKRRNNRKRNKKVSRNNSQRQTSPKAVR